MSKLNKYPRGGFTLIELLVVVLIIGILAAIALPQYIRATDKAKLASLMEITRAIAESNERYYMIHDTYSTNFNELDIEIQANSINESKAIFDWGYCQLFSTQEAICYDMVRLKNLYTVYYQNSSSQARKNATYCGAITEEDNSRYDKLCQSVGAFLENTIAIYNGEIYPCKLYVVR